MRSTDPVETAVCLLFMGEPTDRALAGWCPHRKTMRVHPRRESLPDLEADQEIIAFIISAG